MFHYHSQKTQTKDGQNYAQYIAEQSKDFYQIGGKLF